MKKDIDILQQMGKNGVVYVNIKFIQILGSVHVATIDIVPKQENAITNNNI
jgi:hypothetical protein